MGRGLRIDELLQVAIDERMKVAAGRKHARMLWGLVEAPNLHSDFTKVLWVRC